MISGHLDTVFTLVTPLSHIGQSLGPDSFLDTQDIIGPDGLPVEVFVYHGNAWRGALRDAGGQYLLNALGGNDQLRIPLQLFYLLFSGGSIGGDQKLDIVNARKLREALPILSVFGGAIGHQMLPGKVSVSDGYPFAAETRHFLPEQYQGEPMVSWRRLTTERSHSRMDDAKNDALRPYLVDALALDAGAREDAKKGNKDKPQQMRYTTEVLVAGAKLWQRSDLRDVSPVELGALTSAIVQWSTHPYLGGQNRVGFGRMRMETSWHAIGVEPVPFLSLSEEGIHLADPAAHAKAAYDDYLTQYQAYLAENREGLVKILGPSIA